MKKANFYSALVVPVVLGATGSAEAAVIQSNVNFFKTADASSNSQSIFINDSATVVDVDVTVGYLKCSGTANSNRTCSAGGSNSGWGGGSSDTYNNELSLWLTKNGRRSDLIRTGQLSGSYNGAYVETKFDDESPNGVESGAPSNGIFRPSSSLSAFDGLSSFGAWTLGFADSASLDPLAVYRFALDLTVNYQPVISTLSFAGDLFTGDEISFSSIVSDRDNDSLLYEWDFDNDGVFDTSGNSQSSSTYSFSNAGQQFVNLRVSDQYHTVSRRIALNIEEAVDVPEPSTLAILGLGIAGLAVRRRTKK